MSDAANVARRALLVTVLAAVLAAFVGGLPAAAHETTDRSIVVEVDDRRVIVTVPVPFADLGYTDTSGDGLIGADELAEQEAIVAPMLVAAAREEVSITLDSLPSEIIGAGVPSPSEFGGHDGSSAYALLVLASSPHDGDVTSVGLESGFDAGTAVVVVTHAGGTITGELGDDDSIAVSLDDRSGAASLIDLDAEHIGIAGSHVLFALVLALAASGATAMRRQLGERRS